MNLAARFFDVARRQPHQPAVSDDRQGWSYGELAQRVERVAGGLQAHALAPGDRVLLSLENCGEFLAWR
jgi:acyl-CoA synthetase (AMP-forming)/AMP-acid ligase II